MKCSEGICGMHTRKTNDESFAKCEIATHSAKILAQCFLENQIQNRMACNQPIIINERTLFTLLHIHTYTSFREASEKKNRNEVKQLSCSWQMNICVERMKDIETTEARTSVNRQMYELNTDECCCCVYLFPVAASMHIISL